MRAAAEVVITYKKSYRITAIVSDQGGGRITVDEPHVLENMFVYVPEGDRITFTFTPDMGYEIDYVRVDGTQVTLTSDNKYTITDVKKTHTVSVVFKHSDTGSTTYSIYASAAPTAAFRRPAVSRLQRGRIWFSPLPRMPDMRSITCRSTAATFR